MISLDHLLIDEAIFTTSFQCDVQRCKGACCTLPGGGGAPVADGEVEEIRASVAAALTYLPVKRRAILMERGPLEGHDGAWATTCIDDRDCVFVVYEGDVAACSIEKAWHAGETAFRKPLSCHLFPIRIASFGGPYLHYQEFEECSAGRDRGRRESVPLISSVREALVRAFGEEIVVTMEGIGRDMREGRQ